MLILRNQSIKRRLTVLLVLVGACMFLASYLTFLTYERSALRKSLVLNLRTQALVLSEAISADLDFGGLLNSVKSMKFLATNKHILAARVFDAEGKVFTSMVSPRHRGTLPSTPPTQDSAQFQARELDLAVRIYQDGEFKGTLFLVSDLAEMDAQFRQTVKILATTAPIFLILVLLTSTLLQRQISGPIAKLTETTDRISREADFSLRLRHTQGGEIGALADAFNAMLDQLQRRDTLLLDYQEHLEEQVLQRSEQLLQTKQLLSATLDAMPVFIAILDGQGVILSTNQRWAQFSDPANRFIFAANPGSRYQEAAPPVQAVIAGRQERAHLDYDFAGVAGHRWFTVQATGFVTADTHHTVLMHLDVTEQKLLEIHLRQAQKLESIGQLAAGIAHEINTPTQYIGDNTVFLQEAFQDLLALLPALTAVLEAPTPERLEAARRALDAADLAYLEAEVPRALTQSREGVARVARIVSAMKDFSHPGTDRTVPTDLNRAIESTTIVCRGEWKYVADLVLELSPELPAVPCLPDEFNQVILNLVINAAHAIAEAQVAEPGRPGIIKVSTSVRDEFAEIRIQDSGTGIPEAIRSRIFDPFFTTKPVGKGTGQGLAIAYATIVNKHGGTISVTSEPGHGSTFLLRLPLQARDAQPETDSPTGEVTI